MTKPEAILDTALTGAVGGGGGRGTFLLSYVMEGDYEIESEDGLCKNGNPTSF